jgi:hypothetical protein
VRLDYTRNRSKRLNRGEVLVNVKYSTLSQASDASVVHMEVSTAKQNSIRLIMSHLLSPIIGDNLFGSRVKRVLGVPVPVSIHNDASDGPQVRTDPTVGICCIDYGYRDQIVLANHALNLCTPDHLLLDRSPNIGPLISR